MSIYLKDKALVPYHGDNRPLNVYRGGKKIAGYHDEERSGDGPHEWDDTYNDRVSGEIHGNGDLQSEYYAFERDSEQVQTEQGKNLLDPAKCGTPYIINGSGAYVPTTGYLSTGFIPVIPSTEYRSNKTTSAVFYFDINKTYISDLTTGQTISTPLNCYYVRRNYPDNVSPNTLMMNIGTTLLPYEPFTPNSPSPEYPSPVTPNITAGAYKITMPDGTYEVTLPTDIHGITGVRDRVVVDYVSKRGWLDGRMGVKVFDGTENLGSVSPESDRGYHTFTIGSYGKVVDNICLSSCFKLLRNFGVATPGMNTFAVINSVGFTDSRICIRYTADGVNVPTTLEFKSFLSSQYDAGTPVTVVYQLAEPTQTPLTLTPVDSSTAPELPREFLADATEVSPELPVTIISAQPVVESRGRNLFDMSVSELYNFEKKCLVATVYAQQTRKRLKDFCPNLKAGDTATLSGVSAGKKYIYLSLPVESIWTFNTTKTITEEMLGCMVYIYTQDITEPLPVDIWLQLELGSTANPYTPYRAPTTLEFPELRAIALPETATEWTYIRDGVKYWADTAVYAGGGWWDVVRRCELYVFTGVQPYHVFKNDSNPNSYLYYRDGLLNKKRGIGVCTHFTHVLPYPTIAGTFSCSASTPTIYINFRGIVSADNATLTDANEANAYLAAQYAAGTPVTVLYQLAEPTTERVHLGTLKSYPRYTHVEQIQDGLKAWMELECKVINNI